VIKLICGDCLEVLKTLPDESVDAVITDPPYGYLSHKLDAAFDPVEFFQQAYRVLSDDGMLIFFGRGVVLARWMCICEDLRFNFKEELVWRKQRASSPLSMLGRRHELAMVFSKGSGKIRKVKIDYIQSRLAAGNIDTLVMALSRIKSSLVNIKTWEQFKEWLEGAYLKQVIPKHNITHCAGHRNRDAGRNIYQSLTDGARLESVISVNTENYKYEHPTQKPVQLMEYLIDLCTDKGMTVLDPFMGSGSTGIAAKNLGRDFIGIEISPKYLEIAQQRIDNAQPPAQQELIM